MMSRLMRLAKWALGTGMMSLAACGGLGTVQGGFSSSATTGSRIELSGERIVRLSVPIDEADLPENVQMTVAAIQPRGRTIEVARVWSDRGEGHQITVVYGEFGAAKQRSVLVGPNGEVLRRSHEISVDVLGDSVLGAVRSLGLGTIHRVEVVQEGAGEEYYRFELQGPKGNRSIAICALSGANLRTARICDAELLFWE